MTFDPAALKSVPLRHRSGVAVRFSKYKYVRTMLDGQGATMSGGRYNPLGLRAVYLAWDAMTALAEMQLAVNVAVLPHLLVSVPVDARGTLDLISSRVRDRLVVTRAELLEDWSVADTLAGIDNLTQAIGRQAHALGSIDAIEFPSARRRGGVNLVVFPDRLSAPLKPHDPGRELT